MYYPVDHNARYSFLIISFFILLQTHHPVPPLWDDKTYPMVPLGEPTRLDTRLWVGSFNVSTLLAPLRPSRILEMLLAPPVITLVTENFLIKRIISPSDSESLNFMKLRLSPKIGSGIQQRESHVVLLHTLPKPQSGWIET